jgi:hypothetical protein
VLVRAGRERQPPVIRSHYLPKEAFGRGNIAFGAEHKFDCISFFIHGTVQVLTGLPDFEVRLIHPIRRAAIL